MKRLRDIEPRSPLLEKAQALIDSVEPLPESRERMARVRRELDRPRGALAGLRRLPALVLAALVALFGASAFAAVRYLAARPEPTEQASEPSAALAKRAHRAHKPELQPAETAPAAEPTAQPSGGTAPALRGGASMPAALSPEPAQPAPEPKAHANSATAPRVAPRRTAPRVAARIEPPADSDTAPALRGGATITHARANDSALVHRALKALRRDGDPALAARLLEENRKRYPQGPLAEEALSLQIEAALALHDAHARAFAREYLARYPAGRYLAVAQRALEDATP